jgi:hypothetical protein
MALRAGVWIDGKKAILVFLDGRKVDKRVVLSNIDRHPGRFSGDKSVPAYGTRDFPAGDHEERYYLKQVTLYYDQLAPMLRSCSSVLILGPGESRRDFADRLRKKDFPGEIAGVEPADRMTEPQLVARVKAFFAARS